MSNHDHDAERPSNGGVGWRRTPSGDGDVDIDAPFRRSMEELSRQLAERSHLHQPPADEEPVPSAMPNTDDDGVPTATEPGFVRRSMPTIAFGLSLIAAGSLFAVLATSSKSVPPAT